MDLYATCFNLPISSRKSTSTSSHPSSPTKSIPPSANPISTFTDTSSADYSNRSRHSKADSIDSTSLLYTPANDSKTPKPASIKRHSTSSLVIQTQLGTNSTSAVGNNGTNNQNIDATTNSIDSNRSSPSVELNEAMERLCAAAMVNTQCVATCTPIASPIESERGYSVHLTGAYQQVMAARGTILRGSPFPVSFLFILLPFPIHPFARTNFPFSNLKKKSIVKVPRSEVLDDKENMRPEMRRKLDEIAIETKTHLSIVGEPSVNDGESEKHVDIVITGKYEGVEQARVKLLVLLDELVRLHLRS